MGDEREFGGRATETTIDSVLESLVLKKPR
jgi:hypothetical protein